MKKLVDYGLYLLKQEANGEISFFALDGMVGIEGIPIVGRDSAEVATIREALVGIPRSKSICGVAGDSLVAPAGLVVL